MYGRSVGYTYAKDGATQQTVTTGYAADGRIASAGFLHSGAWAGAKGGALVGGVIGSSAAGAGAPPGAVVGGIVGGIIGAAAGWWGGTTLAEIVYDWVFTSLEKEEYLICKAEE